MLFMDEVVERIEETIGRHATTIIAFVPQYSPAIITTVLVYFVMSVALSQARVSRKMALARASQSRATKKHTTL